MPVQVKDLSGKIAAMLGTDPKQIAINDLAVNPLSGNVYLSVSRGRGPDATPVLVRIHADGKLEDVSLENVQFAKAELPNVPGARQRGSGPSRSPTSRLPMAAFSSRGSPMKSSPRG